MRAIYYDALVCDFAQYYNLDIDTVGIYRAAILACGLPPDSRVIKELSGQKYSTDTILHMGILDAVRAIGHAYASTHSKKKIPKPQSIFKAINGKSDNDIKAFRSGNDFERERSRIIRGTKDG